MRFRPDLVLLTASLTAGLMFAVTGCGKEAPTGTAPSTVTNAGMYGAYHGHLLSTNNQGSYYIDSLDVQIAESGISFTMSAQPYTTTVELLMEPNVRFWILATTGDTLRFTGDRVANRIQGSMNPYVIKAGITGNWTVDR